MKPVLVLQHVTCEPPGTYEDVLTEHGLGLHRVQLGEGESLPDSLDYSAVVVMGGPMSANDDDQFEWLTPEKKLIARAVEQGIPLWGVCLGSQLLAASLGARVYAGESPEVGVLPVRLTPDGRKDPCFADLPEEFLALQWHGDTFELPEGATHLVSSTEYANQAFCVGSAYAVQFHLEVTADLAAEWATVPEYNDALEQVRGPGAIDHLLGDVRTHSGDSTLFARTIFERWLENFVLPGAS